MKYPATLALLAAGLLGSACADAPTSVQSQLTETAFLDAGGARRVGVMTQNLYVGADVDAVEIALMSEDSTDDLPALMAAIQTLGETDFPARASAIVDEIARQRPHAVAFQEVSEIYIDLSAFGGPTVNLPFLPIIESKLAERGLHYTVAAVQKNLEVSLLEGAVRLVDYDAILVNTDLATVDYTHAQNFTYNVGEIAPGVELKRGFVAVWATIEGVQHVFVSTHLEPNIGPYELSGLRAAQAAEIAAVLGTTSPAIVMGDLNDPPGTPMYQVFQQAGFTDAWQVLRPGEDGFTAGAGFTSEHPANLSDPERGFVQRIDYVWARGTGHPTDGLQGQIKRFGAHPSDRINGPYFKIWPSDHAALITELVSPVAAGER